MEKILLTFYYFIMKQKLLYLIKHFPVILLKVEST